MKTTSVVLNSVSGGLTILTYIIIGQTINVYQLPQRQPISVTTCAGEKAQDATISATDVICINTAGKLISQRLQKLTN